MEMYRDIGKYKWKSKNVENTRNALTTTGGRNKFKSNDKIGN